jgi:hypothetical protein
MASTGVLSGVLTDRTEADMKCSSVAAMLLIALLVLPAAGAQKTVLYEHFTASW